MQRELFEAHARLEGRHWWFTARREILRAIVARVATPGAPVADIGCGTGGNAAAFAAAGHHVLGLDPSREAIALATERFPGTRFVVSDEPRDATAHLAAGGVALCTDVLEHVADDRGLLAGAVAALPAGGHLVVTVPADPALWSPHDVAFGHLRRYDVATLAALWADLPVTPRLLSPFNSRLRPLVEFRRRLPGGRNSATGDLALPMGVLNRLFRAAFASEAPRLLAALDTGRPAFRRGISLLAVLRRR